ncbi:unnamed protein product [Agarophyton chilense]|eukprot:gb/GEZJ01002020.1/.p1 GENE.gb/GEZJ01002020.1/~~gb/GEZJ01002020.1/.p1  ORF type:complete len:463 (+),score=56.18 gb/GEZJ01002020.1/:4144-5532(+)
MVFIAIGAIKAAKAAKKEYDKDKKRSEIITPLHNSRRNEFDNGPSSASPDWWSSDQPQDSGPQPRQVSRDSFGAWSRDQLRDQIAEQQARQEEYDFRFREQLSNSSASLGSIAVPSASHSPAVPVSQTRSDLDKAEHSHGSLKQILPPTILPPLLENEEESKGKIPDDRNLSASAVTAPTAKPPRPTKQPTYVEGSYEANLRVTSKDVYHKKGVECHVADGSRGRMRVQDLSTNDRKSDIRAVHGPDNASEPCDGSYESAFRKEKVTPQHPSRANLSVVDGINQSHATPPSAFSFSGNRLTKRRSMPMHFVTANSPTAEGTTTSQTAEKHTVQGSAFGNASTVRKAYRAPSSSSNSPDGIQPILLRTKSAVNGDAKQTKPGSAFQQEGLYTKTRRKPRDPGAASTGLRTCRPPRTNLQGNVDQDMGINPSHGVNNDAPAGTSCMSAEGSMKKKRERRPLWDK